MTLESVSFSDENGLVFTETYAQTYFNPTFDEDLFRAAAPLGYKLVPYFSEEATTVLTPPDIAAR